jgi:hypothetical protein
MGWKLLYIIAINYSFAFWTSNHLDAISFAHLGSLPPSLEPVPEFTLL